MGTYTHLTSDERKSGMAFKDESLQVTEPS
jgi:hypothetical protein